MPYMRTKGKDKEQFNSVAEFMDKTGLSDADLAKLLDVDRSEAVRLRQGRRFRSLVKPLRVSRVCRVPIEKLAPPTAA
jgi:transcriptional regulator with XRE-family HTH domain